MAMDPVNGIGQIVQILRRKLADRPNAKAATAKRSAESGQATQQEVTPDEIRRKISARIQALAADERQGAKAARVFVESIIAWEFGEEVMQDPLFADLSDEVLATINADPSASARLKTLLTTL